MPIHPDRPYFAMRRPSAPLQAIAGFTELMRTLDLSPDRREAALVHIGAATDHVLSMVDDLLDIARIETDAPDRPW